jgi:hypothetical protein
MVLLELHVDFLWLGVGNGFLVKKISLLLGCSFLRLYFVRIVSVDMG